MDVQSNHHSLTAAAGFEAFRPWIVATAAPAQTTANFTICTYITNQFLTRVAFTTKHAVWFHSHAAAPETPGVTLVAAQDAPSLLPQGSAPVLLKDFSWNVTFLGNGALSVRNHLRAWVLSGKVCDALVGPSFSVFATAMGPLVESSAVAWVDPFATAAVLGDNAAYPAFSRVFPTSESTAATFARLALQLGWTSINTICTDDPYPRAVVGGFESEFMKHNGTVQFSRCMSNTVSKDQFDETMRSMEAASSSRVLLLSAMEPAQTTMWEVLTDKGYDKRFVILMMEICGHSIPAYLALTSVLCIAPSYDHDGAAAFRRSFEHRNITEDREVVRELPQWSGAGTNLTEFTAGLPWAHDATLHAMRSLVLHHTLNRTVNYATAVRKLRTTGLTGTIEFDHATGNRPETMKRLFNTRGGNQIVIAEISAAGDLTFLDADGNPTGGTGKSPPPLVLLGAVTDTIPSGQHPQSGITSAGANVTIIIAVVVLGAVLIGAVAAVFGALWWGWSRSGTRNNRNAPSDSLKPFTIVFTDIQASTALWSHVPEQMSEAVDIHHATIRRLIAQHDGYEVKTIGDAFMVAFSDATDAISFSLDVQRHLFRAVWPSKIGDTYAVLASCRDDSALWNGLRVRIGVHRGLGKVQVDSVSKGYDYYGTVVNTAARVEAVGHGGQTLVTAAAIEALHRQSATLAGAVANDLGAQRLRGLTEPVALYELLPSEFAERTFPPLRLDVEVDDAEREQPTESLGEGSLDNTRDTERSHTRRTVTSGPSDNGAFDNADAVLQRLAAAAAKRRHRTQNASRSARSAIAGGLGNGATPLGSPDMTPTGLVPIEPPQVPRVTVAVGTDANYALPGQPGSPLEPSTVAVEEPIALLAGRTQQAVPQSPLVADDVEIHERQPVAASTSAEVGDLVFLVSFLRKMHSVVPAQERHGIIAQYAKRWHAKVTTPGQVRRKRGAGAGEKYCADVSSIRTTMALVERVWLTLDA